MNISAVLNPSIMNMAPLNGLYFGASHLGVKVIVKHTKHIKPIQQYRAVLNSKNKLEK